MNLLILALFDMTRYSQGRMLSRASAGHALSAGMSIILTALLALSIYLGPRWGGATIAGIGPGSILLLLAYVAGARLVYVGQIHAAHPSSVEKSARRSLGLKSAIGGFIAAAGIIVVAASFLASASKDLAEQTGLGGTFFGTLFVAICTSLPEVVTTFTAIRMKAFDLALGNIFGSNCFNMVVLVMLDVAYPGSLLSSVSATHVFTALCVIVITTVVLLGQLYQVERKKHFLEPDALIVVGLVIAALTGVYYLR
jgi:cation:H+ antiporter